jgi:ATP-dependent Lhr-like helicase
MSSLKKAPEMINFSKWGYLLPLKYQVILLQEKYYDIENTKNFLANINLVSPS